MYTRAIPGLPIPLADHSRRELKQLVRDTTAREAERAARVDRVDKLAYLLDGKYRIPGLGFRLGWDAILGLIPGVGDLASMGISAYLVLEAHRAGVSRWTLARMIGNVGVDALVGIVPVFGDLFDVAFKANARNAKLLRRALQKQN